MIEAYIGDPGEGKTYLATRSALKQARRAVKKKMKRRIFVNYPFNVPEDMQEAGIQVIPYGQLSELFHIRKQEDELSPLILMDEANLVAPAMAWKAIPLDVMSHWCQHRHYGVNIIYMAQDFTAVCKPLRMVTQFVSEVRRMGKVIWWKTYHPRRKKDKYGGGITWISNEVTDRYNSWAESVEKQDFLKGV